MAGRTCAYAFTFCMRLVFLGVNVEVPMKHCIDSHKVVWVRMGGRITRFREAGVPIQEMTAFTLLNCNGILSRISLYSSRI